MKKFVKNLPGLCWIAVGNLIYAVIVVLFVLPGQLISCGTTGLALVAQQLWGIPVSGFVFVFNVAMLLLGLAILGKKFSAPCSIRFSCRGFRPCWGTSG